MKSLSSLNAASPALAFKRPAARGVTRAAASELTTSEREALVRQLETARTRAFGLRLTAGVLGASTVAGGLVASGLASLVCLPLGLGALACLFLGNHAARRATELEGRLKG